MKEKFRNIFWFFGIFAIVVMLCTFDMDYQELWQNLRKAGIWFRPSSCCGCSSTT